MSRHNQFFRLRAGYLLALGVIVVLGLFSRRVAWLPNSVGDMFWAMMVFCIIRLVFVRWPNMSVGAVALIISFFVEFSQLIQWGGFAGSAVLWLGIFYWVKGLCGKTLWLILSA